jgi:hypothetical protein
MCCKITPILTSGTVVTFTDELQHAFFPTETDQSAILRCFMHESNQQHAPIELDCSIMRVLLPCLRLSHRRLLSSYIYIYTYIYIHIYTYAYIYTYIYTAQLFSAYAQREQELSRPPALKNHKKNHIRSNFFGSYPLISAVTTI